MWLITKEGFFSINQTDQNALDDVQVRTRRQEHLIAMCECIGIQPTIERTEHADYLWRMNISKFVLADYLSRVVFDLDYDNVKNKIAKHRPELCGAMGSLWHDLYQLQC